MLERSGHPGLSREGVPVMCGYGGMWHHGYWGWGGWIGTAIVLTLFFALVITAIVATVRYLGGPGHSRTGGARQRRAAGWKISSPKRFRPRERSTTGHTVAASHCCGNTSEAAPARAC